MDGASNPVPASEATEGHLPHTNSHALGACGCGNRPLVTPAVIICHGPQGPHLAMAKRMRDGRRLSGSATGEERRERQDLEGGWASRPRLLKLGAGASSLWPSSSARTGMPGRKRHANPKKGRSRVLRLRDRGEVGKGAGVSARRERSLEPRSWGQRLRNYCCSSSSLPSWFPEERGRTGRRSSNDFCCLSIVISLVFYIFSGKAWAEGKGVLATCRHRADSGRETDKMYAAIV